MRRAFGVVHALERLTGGQGRPGGPAVFKRAFGVEEAAWVAETHAALGASATGNATVGSESGLRSRVLPVPRQRLGPEADGHAPVVRAILELQAP